MYYLLNKGQNLVFRLSGRSGTDRKAAPGCSAARPEQSGVGPAVGTRMAEGRETESKQGSPFRPRRLSSVLKAGEATGGLVLLRSEKCFSTGCQPLTRPLRFLKVESHSEPTAIR